jgi:CRISPR/Cas system-associated exonuclease Cas4 (RecB family)
LKTLRLFPYLIFPPILFPYRPKPVKEAGKYFDQVVTKILEKDFIIQRVPEAKICKECDIQGYCRGTGRAQ